MKNYQYFVQPNNALTAECLNQIPEAQYCDNINHIYQLSRVGLIALFNSKKALQGTGGRASQQPIDFTIWRQLGNDGNRRKLSLSDIEKLLRGDLALKPKYLSRLALHH